MQLPNLLNMALTLVGIQQFSYYKFLSRETNSIGLDESVYASPIIVAGQIQAVPRNLYQAYGLDFQKNYIVFYISKDILDIKRDVSGDQIKYANKTFKCESETDWFAINGWTGVLSVEIPNA